MPTLPWSIARRTLFCTWMRDVSQRCLALYADGKGSNKNTAQEIRVDGKMLDDMNNFPHIGSNIIKQLQHNYVVQETFSHCDRITDTTFSILFPFVRHGKDSFRGSVYMCLYRSSRRPTQIRRDAPPAVPPSGASGKSTQRVIP